MVTQTLGREIKVEKKECDKLYGVPAMASYCWDRDLEGYYKE